VQRDDSTDLIPFIPSLHLTDEFSHDDTADAAGCSPTAAAAARRRASRKRLLWPHWQLAARSYDMVLVRPGGWPLLHTRSPGGHAAAAAGAGTPGPQEPKCGANRRPPAPVALLSSTATSRPVARAARRLPRRPAPAAIAVRRVRRCQRLLLMHQPRGCARWQRPWRDGFGGKWCWWSYCARCSATNQIGCCCSAAQSCNSLHPLPASDRMVTPEKIAGAAGCSPTAAFAAGNGPRHTV